MTDTDVIFSEKRPGKALIIRHLEMGIEVSVHTDDRILEVRLTEERAGDLARWLGGADDVSVPKETFDAMWAEIMASRERRDMEDEPAEPEGWRTMEWPDVVEAVDLARAGQLAEANRTGQAMGSRIGQELSEERRLAAERYMRERNEADATEPDPAPVEDRSKPPLGYDVANRNTKNGWYPFALSVASSYETRGEAIAGAWEHYDTVRGTPAPEPRYVQELERRLRSLAEEAAEGERPGVVRKGRVTLEWLEEGTPGSTVSNPKAYELLTGDGWSAEDATSIVGLLKSDDPGSTEPTLSTASVDPQLLAAAFRDGEAAATRRIVAHLCKPHSHPDAGDEIRRGCHLRSEGSTEPCSNCSGKGWTADEERLRFIYCECPKGVQRRQADESS